MKQTILILAALSSFVCSCDAAKAQAEKAAVAKSATVAENKSAAPTQAESKSVDVAAPAQLVLEETELPGLGKLKMPKGFTSSMEKHWRFDLGNHESINISWEPHGAADLKKAESLANILAAAEIVKSAKTLDNGYHEIERARANDGFTFIALFGKDWYIKCVAPAAKIEVCREIVRSKA